MFLIPDFDYEYCTGGPERAIRVFRHLEDCGAESIVCRVRRSKDGILFLCKDPTLARLCLCEERVEDLRFQEIEALLRLDNRPVLTLDYFLTHYEGSARIVLHFRGFRPSGDTLNRIVRDPRFSFGTDSAEQLGVIAMAYPNHKTVGFASHQKAAKIMVSAGATTLCLYSRDPSEYESAEIAPLRERCEIWLEIPGYINKDLDGTCSAAESLGAAGLVLPLSLIR